MSQHLITTTAAIQTCRRCQQPTLVGIAEGLTATVDLTPLASEAQYLAHGMPTYTLRAGQLHYREPGMSMPIGSPTVPAVLATHVCPPKPQGELF